MALQVLQFEIVYLLIGFLPGQALHEVLHRLVLVLEEDLVLKLAIARSTLAAVND